MAEYDKATETRWIQNYCEHAERAPGHRRIAQPALLSHRLNFWHAVALFSQRLPECKNPSWRARSQQLITGPTAISTSVDTRVRCRHADDGRRPRPRVIFAKAHRPHQLTTIRWALALNRNEKATRGGRAPLPPPRVIPTLRACLTGQMYTASFYPFKSKSFAQTGEKQQVIRLVQYFGLAKQSQYGVDGKDTRPCCRSCGRKSECFRGNIWNPLFPLAPNVLDWRGTHEKMFFFFWGRS